MSNLIVPKIPALPAAALTTEQLVACLVDLECKAPGTLHHTRREVQSIIPKMLGSMLADPDALTTAHFTGRESMEAVAICVKRALEIVDAAQARMQEREMKEMKGESR